MGLIQNQLVSDAIAIAEPARRAAALRDLLDKADAMSRHYFQLEAGLGILADLANLDRTDDSLQPIVDFAEKRANELLRLLFACLEPEIPLFFVPQKDNDIPVGRSKLSGAPDLPQGAAWPACNSRELDFVCQLNLTQVPAATRSPHLPSTGMVWFFWDGRSWGTDADDPNWAVIFDESPVGLRRRQRSTGDGTGNSAAHYLRELFDHLAAPCEIAFSKPARQARKTRAGQPASRRGQLFGDQMTAYQGGFARMDCLLPANGIQLTGYREVDEADPRPDGALAQLDEWRFLLQLDSGYSAYMFFIKRHDLEARRFDNVWFLLETT